MNATSSRPSVQIGSVKLSSPLVVAPMAGMTDSAFRRLVKRQGGCGLVVTEMVSSEGLLRGIDRTLEYAEYTDEERPVSIQIFGGDPDRMAAAAQIVESLGADIVDVNMGCPVPKIAKHDAGCSLMREPAHAADVVTAMAKAVRIPVTVKMRAGWNEEAINAPELAKRVEDAGAAAVAVHGRTAAQSYSGHSDWSLIERVAETVTIPVLGSGDCIEPEQILGRMGSGAVSGVLVGRGVLRNPWILAQARDLIDGRPARAVSDEDRGRFLLEYMSLLLREGVDEAEGFRHQAYKPEPAAESRIGPEARGYERSGAGHWGPASGARFVSGVQGSPRVNIEPRAGSAREARGRDRWVVNKMRALMSWYSKGLDNGSHLRTAINSAESIAQAREIIESFFYQAEETAPVGHSHS